MNTVSWLKYLVSWFIYTVSWFIYPISSFIYPVFWLVYPVSWVTYPVTWYISWILVYISCILFYTSSILVHIYPVSWFIYIQYPGLHILYPGLYIQYPGLYIQYPGWYIYVVKKLNSLGNGKADKIEPIGQENDITGDLETQDDLKRDEDDLADTQATQQVNNALSEPSQLRPKPSTGFQGEDLGIYWTMLSSFQRFFSKRNIP